MNRKFFLSASSVFFLTFSVTCFGTESQKEEVIEKSQPCLLLDEQPPEIKKAAEAAFNTLESMELSYWAENGQLSNYMNHVGADEIFLNYIKNNPQQGVFRIMDLGSGKFQSVGNTLDAIKKDLDISKAKNIREINIYGTRGEKFNPSSKHENLKYPELRYGNCRLHRLGQFTVEDIHVALQDRNCEYFMYNQFDVIDSRYCFLHLVDPLKTLLTAYELVRPGGFMLIDGFPIPLETDEVNKEEKMLVSEMNKNTERLLTFVQDMGVPYLLHRLPTLTPLDYSILLIQKPLNDHKFENLPWEYTSSKPFSFGVGSRDYCKAVYKRSPESLWAKLPPQNTITGDKNLYNYVSELIKMPINSPFLVPYHDNSN